jgi:hypothetical protein
LREVGGLLRQFSKLKLGKGDLQRGLVQLRHPLTAPVILPTGPSTGEPLARFYCVVGPKSDAGPGSPHQRQHVSPVRLRPLTPASAVHLNMWNNVVPTALDACAKVQFQQHSCSVCRCSGCCSVTSDCNPPRLSHTCSWISRCRRGHPCAMWAAHATWGTTGAYAVSPSQGRQ